MKLLNLKTNKVEECYVSDIDPWLGDTLYDNNENPYIVIDDKNSLVGNIPYRSDLNYPNNPEEEYIGIKVAFPTSPKTYSYFVKQGITEQIGAHCVIRTPYGAKTVRVEGYFDLSGAEHFFGATKELQLIEPNVIPEGKTVEKAIADWQKHTSSISIDPNSICISNDIATTNYIDINTNTNSIINEKENKTMNINTNKIFKNLEFGKINTNDLKLSINGLAFKQEDGSYATYDIKKHEFTDVSAFVFNTDFIFAMPVAANALKAGDIIRHMNRYVVVVDFYEDDNTIKIADPMAGEEKVLIPTKNMFGFNYCTKILNVFEGFKTEPNAENPFGNLMPLMLADGSFDSTTMLAMMMMQNGTSTDIMNNPLMMMALLNK